MVDLDAKDLRRQTADRDFSLIIDQQTYYVSYEFLADYCQCMKLLNMRSYQTSFVIELTSKLHFNADELHLFLQFAYGQINFNPLKPQCEAFVRVAYYFDSKVFLDGIAPSISTAAHHRIIQLNTIVEAGDKKQEVANEEMREILYHIFWCYRWYESSVNIACCLKEVFDAFKQINKYQWAIDSLKENPRTLSVMRGKSAVWEFMFLYTIEAPEKLISVCSMEDLIEDLKQSYFQWLQNYCTHKAKLGDGTYGEVTEVMVSHVSLFSVSPFYASQAGTFSVKKGTNTVVPYSESWAFRAVASFCYPTAYNIFVRLCFEHRDVFDLDEEYHLDLNEFANVKAMLDCAGAYHLDCMFQECMNKINANLQKGVFDPNDILELGLEMNHEQLMLSSTQRMSKDTLKEWLDSGRLSGVDVKIMTKIMANLLSNDSIQGARAPTPKISTSNSVFPIGKLIGSFFNKSEPT